MDTLFALAWRKLAQAQLNLGYPLAIRAPAYTRAFEVRDRLSERERHLAAATYHHFVTRELEKALVSYQAMVELDPDDHYPLGNGAGVLLDLGDPARAEAWALRAIQAEPRSRFSYGHAIQAQVRQGRRTLHRGEPGPGSRDGVGLEHAPFGPGPRPSPESVRPGALDDPDSISLRPGRSVRAPPSFH